MPSTRRLLLVAVVLVTLTGCDRYIEQVEIAADGSLDLVVESSVVCSNDDAIELWGGDPCERIDAIAAGDSVDGLPGGLDPTLPGYVFEATGEVSRRDVRVTWSGEASAFESLVAESAILDDIDDVATRAAFDRTDVVDEFLANGRPTRWRVGEFRVVAPEIVVSHNGDEIFGRTVVWYVDEDMPAEFTLTWGAEERGVRVWWWAVGAVVLGVVLIMMVMLEGQRAETERAARRREANSDGGDRDR